LLGARWLRKWERKLFLTADYTIAALYCEFIEKMTHITYGAERSVTYAWLDTTSASVTNQSAQVKLIRQVGATAWITEIPRYQEFRTIALSLASQGVHFVEIAGNSQILTSLLAPRDWRNEHGDAQQLFSIPSFDRSETAEDCNALRCASVISCAERNRGWQRDA